MDKERILTGLIEIIDRLEAEERTTSAYDFETQNDLGSKIAGLWLAHDFVEGLDG